MMKSSTSERIMITHTMTCEDSQPFPDFRLFSNVILSRVCNEAPSTNRVIYLYEVPDKSRCNSWFNLSLAIYP